MANKNLRVFEQFGLEFKGNNGVNHFADCPFSGKENKFYVNEENGMWDSKTTGRSGNIYTFIRDFFAELKANTEAIDVKPLADQKKLPTWVLTESIAYNPLTNRFLVPYYNGSNEIINIGHYDLTSKKLIKCTGLKQMFLGLNELVESDSNVVYLCEGEWDYYIMRWLIKRNGLQHTVIGLPGANVFKEEWVGFFKDKEVHCLLDNDEAGRNGSDRLQKMLALHTFKMKYINWPVDTSDKYDIRDFILDYNGDITSFRTKHKSCLQAIMKMMHPDTPNELLGLNRRQEDKPVDVNIPKPWELDKVFKKWFKLRQDDISLDILMGTCFANKIEGDVPVWMYFVGSPGSRKTAMLMSLNKSPLIETVSTLTPASLVSGLRATGSEDPSLIPKLDKRILVIKDVTTILSSNSLARDEIFGMLRDAFDGYVEKVFSGIKKSFKSKFGVIGAVTPVIDGYQSAQSILGERFLKFRIEPEMGMDTEFDIIQRTLDNIDNETVMNNEMQDIVYRMLAKQPPKKRIPFESAEVQRKMIYLGMFVAKMRGSINANVYTKEQQSMPIKEVGTRITKQLTKLAMGISIFRDHESIGWYELDRCKIVARDTCPDRTEIVIRLLHVKNKPVYTQEIIDHTMLSPGTISTLLSTLVSLKLITRISGGERMKTCYQLSENTKQLIEKSEVYNIPLNETSTKIKSIRIRQRVNNIEQPENHIKPIVRPKIRIKRKI